MQTTTQIERIAILAGSSPPFGGGGISSSHFNLFQTLKSKGYKVKVFTFREGGLTHPSNVDIVRGGLTPTFQKAVSFVILAIFRAMGDNGMFWQFPGAVTGALGGALAWRKIRRFQPQVVLIPDHGSPGALFPKVKGIKRVLISHHNPARFADMDFGEPVSARDVSLALKLERHMLKKIDGVVCPSDFMANIFKETHRYGGPVKMIPNIVDSGMIEAIEKAALHEEAGLRSDVPIVYIPSGGSLFKGSQFVIEIIKKLSSSYGSEVGFYLSGDVKDSLKLELANIPKNARLIMPGKTSYKENISNIKSCRLCVSPTLLESFGMAILEAQLCGLPVVTYDVGGTGEILEDGKTGRLVPLKDMEELVASSAQLLNDRQACSQMGLDAEKYALNKFDIDSTVNNLIRFIEEL